MRLNPKSWHARWYKFVSPDMLWLPGDLCSYFWMWNILTLRVVILLTSCLTIVGGFIYVLAIAFKIVCMIAVGLGYLVFFVWAFDDWSIVGAWISAKKRDICPLIEWAEKEEAADGK